ncbi:MAG TPA: organic hydroperoxide resistance protein [Paracoccaceae bacterium]|nr:organic hydroperoxide resistance protein [Paracoccaceae bacterium]
MTVDVKYTTSATAKGGRRGSARTDDGNMEVTMTTPSELGGQGGEGTNPEQLFAMGYAACLLGAIKAAAGKDLRISKESTVTAKVGIGPRSEGGFGITAEMDISLPDIEREKAEEIVRKAHEEICPYSHATRGNVDVKINIV